MSDHNITIDVKAAELMGWKIGKHGPVDKQGIIRHPTYSASDDYEVYEFVLDNWTQLEINRFYEELDRIQRNTDRYVTVVEICRYRYVKGDYARALVQAAEE